MKKIIIILVVVAGIFSSCKKEMQIELEQSLNVILVSSRKMASNGWDGTYYYVGGPSWPTDITSQGEAIMFRVINTGDSPVDLSKIQISVVHHKKNGQVVLLNPELYECRQSSKILAVGESTSYQAVAIFISNGDPITDWFELKVSGPFKMCGTPFPQTKIAIF